MSQRNLCDAAYWRTRNCCLRKRDCDVNFQLRHRRYQVEQMSCLQLTELHGSVPSVGSDVRISSVEPTKLKIRCAARQSRVDEENQFLCKTVLSRVRVKHRYTRCLPFVRMGFVVVENKRCKCSLKCYVLRVTV